MKFYLITLFPKMFDSFRSTSIIGKAIASGTIALECVDPRSFTADKHHTVDDAPYGGGDGMVLKVEPFVRAIESVAPSRDGVAVRRVLLTPQGRRLTQSDLQRFSQLDELILICGRYEGFDERTRAFVDEEVSLGDFVMTGGELAAQAIIDGVSRLIPTVLGNLDSVREESHVDGLLEYPHYTRPPEFRGLTVPEVLLSGNHEAIAAWRRSERIERTKTRRPDLWRAGIANRTYVGLLHHPVYNRQKEVVTTALTNLDLHDIARAARTYGVAGYHVITPIPSQQQLIAELLEHWRSGFGATYNDDRREALERVELTNDFDEFLKKIETRTGRTPTVVATSAKEGAGRIDEAALLDLMNDRAQQPLAILFGTGWGISEEVLDRADSILTPLKGVTDYNHLSVRSAAAILLDRLFGMRD